MKLEQAKRYASKITEWIAPYCHRIEVAGSVRRESADCNDIGIVCIPKLQMPPTGDVPESLLRDFLMKYVEESNGEAWFRSSAGIPGRKDTFVLPDSSEFLMHLRKCDADIYAANEANFITRLVVRTGPVEHNIWISDRAEAMGGGFDQNAGLLLNGRLIQPRTEEEFYAALGLPYVEPRNRRIDFLKALSKKA